MGSREAEQAFSGMRVDTLLLSRTRTGDVPTMSISWWASRLPPEPMWRRFREWLGRGSTSNQQESPRDSASRSGSLKGWRRRADPYGPIFLADGPVAQLVRAADS